MEEQNYNSLQNETREKDEIETGEIKSFKSFLKLCWQLKFSRCSIILGLVIIFIGAFIAMKPFVTEVDDMHGFEGVWMIVVSMYTIAISSLVVVVGMWIGTRKVKKVAFLKFLFTICVIIISLGWSYVSLFIIVRYIL